MIKQPELKSVINTLATRIRARRRSLQLTQEELSERAGISVNFLARMELGQRTPSLATLVQLSGALGVDMADLLSGAAETREPEKAEIFASIVEGLPESDADALMKQLRLMADHLRQLRKDCPPT